MNKKANASLDTILLIVMVVIMGIGGMYAFSAFDTLNSEIQNDIGSTEKAKEVSGDLYSTYPTLIDNLFLLAFVLLTFFIIISVFMIDTHPIFMVINVIILIIIFGVGMLLGDFFEDTMNDDELVTYANQMTYIPWIMSNVVTLMVTIGFIVLITMFIKYKGLS